MTPDRQTGQTAAVGEFYEKVQREDRNLALSRNSGIVNHHFGIGQIDWAKFPPNCSLSQADIAQIINDLERNQITHLMKAMVPIEPTDVILDAGSGRGGTAFTINHTFGAKVHGITISQYQASFSQNLADNYWENPEVDFSVMNMLQLGFPEGSFNHVVTNETTMYIQDLSNLFSGFSKVLVPGGKYTLATWCINEDFPGKGGITRRINHHYPGTRMHTRRQYLNALNKAGYENIRLIDLTKDAIPHWEIRSLWENASGIESAYLDGHKSGKLLYLMISAQKPKA